MSPYILPQFVLLKLPCNRCKLKLGYVTNNFFLLAATSFAKESLIKYTVVRMRLKRRSSIYARGCQSKIFLFLQFILRLKSDLYAVKFWKLLSFSRKGLAIFAIFAMNNEESKIELTPPNLWSNYSKAAVVVWIQSLLMVCH